MLPKETLLGILAQLPESHLVKALDAAGVDVSGAGGDQSFDYGEESPDDTLQSWNAREVKVPASSRPPLFDRGAILDEKPPQPQQRPYAEPEQPAPNIASFAASAAPGAMGRGG